MQSMFDGALAFNQDIEAWDVSSVENFSRMFAATDDFNQPLNSWDVSSAINLSRMFAFTEEINSFNQPLNGWGTKLNGVTTMEGMFESAAAFNQDLNSWDVSTVQNFDRMFRTAILFNGNISSWTLTAADDMSQMFIGAQAFDSDITTWDVSNVTNMSGMFAFTDVFNQDISGWDVSNVTDMGGTSADPVQNGMFEDAILFDQNLANWDIGSVTDMEGMLDNTAVSTANYEATLNGWAPQTVQPNVLLGAAGLIYCDATGRDILTNTPNNWTINGDFNCPGLPFITTWQTTAVNESITIPTFGTGYNYFVEWGDGTTTSGNTGDATHTYAVAGTYTVSINGDFPRIRFDGGLAGQDILKIISIEQWGEIAWTSMQDAFWGCSNLIYNATDIPDLSNATSLERMFRDCALFDGDVSTWVVNTIDNMAQMFKGASVFTNGGESLDWGTATSDVAKMNLMFEDAVLFNQNVGDWDVSSVDDMQRMFSGATAFNNGGNPMVWATGLVLDMGAMFFGAAAFNQNISSWNVGSVTIMSSMFQDATGFNNAGEALSWGSNTSSVTDMSSMFFNATIFNADLSSWDVGSVQDMRSMFFQASDFNNGGQPLTWNAGTDLVEDMANMFRGATAFNQDISSWDVGSVRNMGTMFFGASVFNNGGQALDWGTGTSQVEDMAGIFRLATAFDQDLGGWNISSTTTMASMLDNSGLSTANYEATLNGWAPQTVQSNVVLGAAGLTYCDATGRDILTNSPNNWTINGDASPVDITAIPIPTAATICNGGSFEFSIGTGVQTGYTYTLFSNFVSLIDKGNEITSWTEGTPLVNVTLTDGSNGIVGGLNLLTVVGSDGTPNCLAVLDATISITINPDPTVSITADDASICEGDATNLNFALTGSPPFSVTYDNGTNVLLTGLANGSTETVSPTTTTTYTIVSAFDANGCDATDLTSEVEVIVNPIPAVEITTTITALCESDGDITLAANLPSGTWTIAGSASTDLFSPSALGTGTFEVIYSLTQIGCTGSDTITIEVIAAPNAGTYTGTAEDVCSSNSAFDLTSLLDGSQDVGGSWADTDNSGALITGNNTDFTGVAAGTYQFIYTIAGTGTCPEDSEVVEVIITAPPNAGLYIGTAGEVCNIDAVFDLTTLLDGTQDVGGNWTETGTSATIITDDNANFTGVATGSYTFRYTVVGTAPCADEFTEVTVIVNPAPDATINPAGPFCSADSPIELSPATAGGMWGGSAAVNETTGFFDPSQAAIGSNTITYTLQIGNCSDTKSINIVVNPNPNVVITPVSPVCVGDSPVTLSATPSGGTWAGDFTNSTTGEFDPAASGVGTFVITYTVTVNGCDGTNQVSIEVLDLPGNAAAINGPNLLCSGDDAVFTTTAINGATQYEWTTPTGTVTTDAPTLNLTATAAGQISVSGINNCGAGESASFSFNLQEAVTAGFDFSVSPTNDTEYLFTDTSGGGANSWAWDFGDGATSNQQNPTHTYDTQGNYTVTLTSSNGLCEGTVSQTVNVDTEIIIRIANVITPNNNGQNDFIYIEDIEKYPDHEVQLLNRWGKSVFSSTSFSNDPSAVAGKPDLEPGNYVCVVTIRFGGLEVKRQQMITVIK